MSVGKNPLFSSYRQGENRVTASMLAVFERIDPSVVERLLAGASGESSLSFLSFVNQAAGKGKSATVPDASISASFRYLFEVKTEPNALRRAQLEGHLAELGSGAAMDDFADKRLFVITPDSEQPSLIDEIGDERLFWFNFLALNQAINSLLGDPRALISEQSRFLLRELQALFEQDALLERADVVVVPASAAYPFYLKYHSYVCQAGRGFRQGLTHMGFYVDGVIKPELPRIRVRRDQVMSSPEGLSSLRQSESASDATIAELMQRLIDVRVRTPGDAHQVFLLSSREDQQTVKLPGSIQNTKRDQRGRLWPWAYPQRYTTMAALRTWPKTTDELEAAERDAVRTGHPPPLVDRDPAHQI